MRGADRDQDSVFEWRKIAAFPKLQFLLEVAGEIVMPRKLDRGTKRGVSLDENFARRFTATGPGRDWGEQLKSSLSRAESSKMQRQVGVDDGHRCYVCKMPTLGNPFNRTQTVAL